MKYADLLNDYTGLLLARNENDDFIRAFNLSVERVQIIVSDKTLEKEEKDFEYASAISELAVIEIERGNLNIAYNLLNEAEHIIINSEKYNTNIGIGLLSLVYNRLSRLYAHQDLKLAVAYMNKTIELNKRRFDLSPVESRDAVSFFCVEISELYKEQKNFVEYYHYRNESLKYLIEVHQINPARELYSVFGKYEELLINKIDCVSMKDEHRTYIEKLLGFLDSIKKYNQDFVPLQALFNMTKNVLGMIYFYCFQDFNKAKQLHTEVIREIGLSEVSNENLNNVRNFAFQLLNRMDVKSIMIDGKHIGFAWNNE